MRLMMIFSLLLTLPIQLATVRYNYSYYGDVIHSAPGMNYATHFNANTLGTTLSSPEDIVVYEGVIYMIDSGTNRLYLIDDEFQIQAIHQEFPLHQSYIDKLTAQGVSEFPNLTLNAPFGVEAHESGIYIADSGNGRIVKLNHQFEVLDTFSQVDDPTFDELRFEPRKLTVDGSERIYVVARNVYEGIIELSSDGSFNRFTGVNPVSLTPIEVFRRSLMTEEQLSQLQLY